ncbi:hypothetical protein H0H92_007329 [Tricholoma furcatifolium]|nr:hypothetical protein H0H92_007329 [Tricholoma furcatifolium]
MQEELRDKTELLYSSLNVHDAFPELRNVDYEFVRLLIMARDLKINIRKRAIGSFLEWDKLDQAVGGREQSLGTKLHQATRKAIAKRKPALMNAIRKFNGYCAQLAALHRKEWHIPLPESLPLKLAPLRDSTLLLQDVWISEAPEEEAPRWLQDVSVRNGIRAMLKVDRCLEERRRLGLESDNLCRWFSRELLAVRLALTNPSNSPLFPLLQQQYDSLISLKDCWSNSLASGLRFEAHVTSAETLVHPSTAASQPALTWLPPRYGVDNPPGAHHQAAVVDFDHVQDLFTGEGGEDDGHENYSDDDPHLPQAEDADDDCPVELADLYDDIHAMDDADEDSAVEFTSSALCPPRVKAVWSLPVSCFFNSPEPLIHWTLQEPLYQYFQLLCDFRAVFPPTSAQPHCELPRYFYHRDTRYSFNSSDLSLMTKPRQLLNDVCINGIAALLQRHFSQPSAQPAAGESALFTTFDLLLTQYDVADSEVWRRTCKTEYWIKRFWILPIHRPAPALHWVVALIIPQSRQMFLFDSLAQEEPWKADIEVLSLYLQQPVSDKDILQHIRSFIDKLFSLTNRKGITSYSLDGEWEARPTIVRCYANNDRPR